MMRLQRQQAAAAAFASLRPNGFDPAMSAGGQTAVGPAVLGRPTDPYGMIRGKFF